MRKSRLLLALASLGLCATSVAVPLSVAEPTEPLVAYAEEQAASPAVAINAKIGYRDAEDVPYASGDERIGSFYLSADGWAEGQDEPIVLNAIGNVSSKLDGKVLYLYEYRPTNVVWAGKIVKPEADKTYLLAKPEIGGTYDLEIGFTKTLIQNPTELTSINWESLLTVQNLMTIGAWAVIVVGLLAFGILNIKYRKKGSTTLDDVKAEVGKQINSVVGEEVGNKLNDALGKILHESLGYIDGKLETLNNNNATLIRCFLLMQENTPEARLAVTKCLTELDLAKDGKADEIKSMIEAEIARNLASQQARQEALQRAEETTKKWAESEPAKKDDGDGFGTL